MFTIVVQINKPANAVFTYLSNIESSPRWYLTVKSVTNISPGRANAMIKEHFSKARLP
jgi:uncharacterized membrane protein